MNNGELYVKIDVPKNPIKGGTRLKLTCGNCWENIEETEAPGSWGVIVCIPLNCTKCGARFSKIVGRLE